MKKVLLLLFVIATIAGCNKASKAGLVNSKWTDSQYVIEFARGSKVFLYRCDENHEFTSLTSSGTYSIQKDSIWFHSVKYYPSSTSNAVYFNKGTVDWDFMEIKTHTVDINGWILSKGSKTFKRLD